MELIAILPKDRTQLGKLELRRSGALVQIFDVLGKADNATAAKHKNPSRDPLLPFGDTPTGKWKVMSGSVQSTAENLHTYGPHKVFMLWPLDGQAAKSHEPKYRRSGIWLHGGDLNQAGALRPTYGCLRVHNETMARLHELIAQHGPITTLETKEAL